MLRIVSKRLFSPAVIRTVPALGATARPSSNKPKETEEAFDARWEAYFSRPDLDSWELRRGLNDLYGHDLVPEPKIINAMLHACRRLNDFGMSVRILEAVKDKAVGNKEIYSYILQECKPVIEELGISTPEELGLAK
ncbi:cytochrome c oxidase subunit 5A, mitochondrial [Exaiptasia diaphana]|uniref:Cytochrome c oxidase subunit 5A, mitochondrial n=1 Tax=Exaiptasia diaphana TaxID=2652724 RepID=A0A913Y853_EXADI|nr:cytochrome c oxidase subunit 5A, mitochondrial [Exaiptasia diaphana]KXJ28819.1 Cytochrome c oxidase subunit 5A, mitochondrial [Exaiptasia diaphana]